jgi:ABC-2 type transport system permease protein
MTRWRSIRLVARREVLERGRSRGFILSMLFTTAIVVGSFLLPALLLSDDGDIDLGIVRPAPAGLEPAMGAVAAQFDVSVEPRTFDDRASGQAAVEADEIEALVDVPADLSAPGTILVKDETDDRLRAIVTAAVVALRQGALLEEAGVDPAAFGEAATPPAVDALDPRSEADEAQFLFANIGAVLILVGVFSFGFTVLTGVVEEKQSRVVEVVLSTVRPRDLLMGKVLGIGILGLVQLAMFVAAGLVGGLLTDRLVLPQTAPTAIPLLALWFILGYALYSTALGALGALASRMEEASNASTPVTTVAMVSYFVALFSVLDNPTGIVARVATFFPPAAPMVVPMRAALRAIEPWEVLASIGLTVVAIYALFVVGARVYAGAVLQMAGRMKLRDAWRGAWE